MNLRKRERQFIFKQNVKSKIFILGGFFAVGLLFFASVNLAAAKTFNIFNAAVPTTSYFLVDGTTGYVGIGTTGPLDSFSIGNSGAAPAGSSKTGHNYTSTYLSTDDYALTNYGLVKTLIANATSSLVAGSLWNGTLNGNIWNGAAGAGSVGIGTTNPTGTLNVSGTGFNYVDRFSSAANQGAGFGFRGSRGSLGAPSAVTDGDIIGKLSMHAYDGSAYLVSAQISAVSNGTVAIGSVPTDLVFSTSASSGVAEKMRILSGGNVGIGTTGPGSRLSVQQTSDPALGSDGTGAIRIYNSAGTSYGQLQVNASGVELSSSGSTLLPLYLNTSRAGTPPVTILGSGYVGIGTTAPGALLEIHKDQDAGTQLKIVNVNGTANAIARLDLKDSEVAGQASALTIGSYSQAFSGGALFGVSRAGLKFVIENSNVGYSTGLAVGTQTNTPLILGTQGVERMRILEGGNVGIGTTAPNDTFSIGNSGAAPAGSSKTGHNYTSTYLSTDDYALTNYGLVKTLIANATSTLVAGNLWNGTLNGDIWNGAAGAGKVGIGTTAPGNTLTVAKDAGSSALVYFDSQNATNGYGLAISSAASNAATYALHVYRGGNQNNTSLWVGTAGSVGIGVTNPATTLEVNGTIQTITASLNVGSYTALSTTAANINFFTNAQGVYKNWQIGSNKITGGALEFTPSSIIGGNVFSTPAVTILQGGNVGIGITNPATQLEVSSNTDTGLNVKTTATSNTGAWVKYIRNQTGLTSTWRTGTGINTNSNAFDIYEDAPSAGTRMTILSGGNVGIGTTNPSDILHIKNSTGSNNLRLERSGTTLENTLALYTGATEDWEIGTALATVGSDLDFYKFAAPAGLVMRLTTGGNVGIGTTGPNDTFSIGNSGAAPAGSSKTGHNYTSTYLSTDDYALTNYGIVKTLISTSNADQVDGYHNYDINPLNFYNNVNTTALITTSIQTNQYSMFKGTIKITDFNTSIPTYIYISGTMYNTGVIGQYSAYVIGQSYTIYAFNYGGYLCFHVTVNSLYNNIEANITQGAGYQGSQVNKNYVSSITAVAKPANTNEVTITPVSLSGGINFWGGTKNGNIWNGDAGAGNVGIGTTAPQGMLQVGTVNWGTPNATYKHVFLNNIDIMGRPASTDNYIISNATFDTSPGWYRTLTGYSSYMRMANGGFSFYSGDTGNAGTIPTFTEALTILTGGNVGIGATAPDSLLHIKKTTAAAKMTIESSDSYPAYTNYSAGSDEWSIGFDKPNNAFVFANSDVINNAAIAMVIKSGGNVGVNTTAPNDKFSIGNSGAAPAGSSATGHNYTSTYLSTDDYALTNYGIVKTLIANATSSLFSGDLNMGGHNILNVNKLTVNTIDPLYTLNGINYSTYAASISGGVKEEYVGKIKISARAAGSNEYEKIINFSDEKEGTDLWVWRSVIDFAPDKVEVFLTPYGGFANTYYLIKDNQLIFRSDRPITLSYRLIGSRFDWRKWPTRAINQSEKGMRVE